MDLTTREEVKVTVADKPGLVLSIFLPNSKLLHICGEQQSVI